MLNKKMLPAALATALLAATSVAQADMEISGNVALTTDYKFRGISQSDESAAVQGGFDASWDTGIYVGAWASSVDFDSNDGFDGSLELDYYAGWSSDIGDTDFGIDVGYMYYDYPGDNGAEGDYQEVYGSVSWKGLSVGMNYSDDYYAETGDFYYYKADYSHAFNDVISLDLHVGYNDLEKNGGFLSSNEDSYTDYSVSLTANYFSVDWSIAYVGTDLDDDDLFGTDWGDDAAIFTISKSL